MSIDMAFKMPKFIDKIVLSNDFRLLVFAQNRSNHGLALLMATSFFLEMVLGFGIIGLASFLTSEKAYWWSTAHPLSRLPVFFMGICAGVLCVRIQNGDLDALNRKNDFEK